MPRGCRAFVCAAVSMAALSTVSCGGVLSVSRRNSESKSRFERHSTAPLSNTEMKTYPADCSTAIPQPFHGERTPSVAGLKSLRALRTLRVLRPLRLINRAGGAQC